MTAKPHFRKHADGQISLQIGDGFSNFISGIGGADLKRAGNTYVPPAVSQELETAYRTSTWFGKIIDIPADDACREWRNWQLDNEDIEKAEAEERRLGLKQKVRQALIWQRLYGGSAIICGGLPGQLEEEVDADRISAGSIKFLTVVTREELTAGPVRRNPLDEFYGKPEYYEVRQDRAAGQRLHPSRVIDFQGVQISPSSDGQDFWGDPVWFRLEDAIKSADQSGAVLDALLQEAKIDVLRVNGMMKGMATTEYEALMIRRFTMAALLKGMQNVLLLDKDDEWSQKQVTWNGLPDVAKHILNILSGAADIPMFRLTGQNLTGLSNTGEAEQRAYYDSVRASQNLKLRPQLDKLDGYLIRSALGKYPDNAWYDWASLYQMTEKEKAEIDKLEAETAATYSATGLIPSEALAKAVQSRMIESGRWSALEQALDELPDEEAEDDKLMGELEALLSQAGAQNQQPQRPAAPTHPEMQADKAGASWHTQSRVPAGSPADGQQRGKGHLASKYGPQPLAGGADSDPNDSGGEGAGGAGSAPRAKKASDAAPRSLYIKRMVLNWKEIDAFYKAQGFSTTLGAEMHVTIVYSEQPLDWMKLGASYEETMGVNAGGPRMMEMFGEEAKVLLFNSYALEGRHYEARNAGAVSSYEDYAPHITITYSPIADFEGVRPYMGAIELGPEIFEEINPDWKSGVTEE